MSFKNKSAFLNNANFNLRPYSGPGLWLMLLLPLCLIVSTAKHSVISTFTYKQSSLFSFGLLCTALLFIFNGYKNQILKPFNKTLVLATLITSFLFHICLHFGFSKSLYSGLFATVIYQKLYLMALEKFPYCFSYGEAAICCQGFTLLLYFTINNFVTNLQQTPIGTMQVATCTIQQGLAAVLSTIFLSYKCSIKNPTKFYISASLIFSFFIFISLHILIDKNPLLWIFDQILQDFLQKKIILFWVVCSFLAIIAIRKQITVAQKASTVTRKTFHLLAVAVFLSGLLYNCSFLYLASGVVLGIFTTLELLRIMDIPPLAQSLHNGVIVFGDEKDAGIIALTPIYLLVSCSLPLWIHPAPCDVTNSAGFNILPLLSGILIVGVGDAAASTIGSKLGRFYWNGSKKTIEGTIACIFSQFLVILLLMYFDYLRMNQTEQYIKTVVAVVISSIVEAKTDQIDNLALPLITYLILI